MSSPGTLRFGQVATKPSPPPLGYDLIYVKTDDVLYIQDSSGVEVALGSSSSITQLTGDVSATGPGIATATVNSVGGESAANIASAVMAYLAATPSDTVSTLVLRDSSGNFSAGTITASLNGNATTATNATNATTAVNFTGSLSGDVTGTQSATNIASSVITGKLLTGYTTGTNTPVTPTNSVLTAFENLQAQITASSGSAITALTGDVSATGPGSVPATVNSVGGQTAAAVAAATVEVDAATSSNTASTLVLRNASGNFSAGTITASLNGNATTATTSVNFSGSLSGDVTGTQSATVVSSVDGFTATQIGTSVTDTQNATSLNTPGTLVLRDGSGNFSAGTVTASLIGNVTGNVTGNVSGSSSSFTGSLSGDVTGTQSATSISSTTVTGKLLTGYVAGTNTPITATNSILTAFENIQAQISTTSGAAITALTGDGTATGPGSVPFTLATVNSNVGTFGSSTSIPTFTVNAKGLITAASSNVVIAPAGTLTGTTLASNVVNSSLVIATTQLSGTLQATQFPALTGDVTTTAGSLATHLVATTNSTLTTLSSLSLPGSQVSGNIAGNASNITATSNSTLTTLTALSLPGSQVTGNISGNAANITATSNSTLTSLPNLTSAPSLSITGTQVTGFTQGSVLFAGASGQITQDNPNFYWNDTTFNLGLGVIPATNISLDVVNTSGSSKAIQTTSYGIGSSIPFRGRFARGTLGTPAATQSGDNLSVFSGRGYGASQFATTSTGAINIVAGETFTNTSNLTYLQFQVTPTGSVTLAEHMRVSATGVTLGPQSASTDMHQINGALSGTTRTVTSSTFTVDTTTTDYIIYTDSTSNAITVTLPTPTNGRILVIEDSTGQAATNNITILPHASEKINGASSFVINQNYGSVRLTSDGTNWFVQGTLPNVMISIPGVVAIAASSINWNLGNVFTKTLSANTTFTFANVTAGQTIVVRLTNTASNYTVTWPTIRWAVGIAPVMTTGAVSDVYTFINDGSNTYGSYVQDMF